MKQIYIFKSKNKGKRNIFNLFKPNKKEKQNNTPIKKAPLLI